MCPLNPVNDRQAQLVSGCPGPLVEQVLLQQDEESFHRRVVAGGTDFPHRPEQLVEGQNAHLHNLEVLRRPVESTLDPAIRMDDSVWG